MQGATAWLVQQCNFSREFLRNCTFTSSTESRYIPVCNGLHESQTTDIVFEGWPGLERSDYPGGVSHKKSWEMLPLRREVTYQQALC
uniref:Uncharacterized protein n=1 Tax=Rubinisphaera brasiliensis (strain ATCC 49424 / DSM 5305 / JCM 21570 / IAM 15109 / NBRC 103401 / IFAM 1448) TaxID=756272 RepID=F0SH28_RUBBR|nr:hypothetical protein Plabr_1904 [Rubinisphaera brasiliensis DSM 5305]